YNDEAHRGEVWKKFSAHPKWKEMSKMELYKDTVSKIIAQHMKPLPYSVIQ
ncbi:MAG: NIPSNAP family protein, partial [Verrucomicrobiales bacterium]